MENDHPPFHITNRMLMYVSSISEKIGQINAIHRLDPRPHLRKNNRIRSIHSSLKIEANSLSLDQVRDIIDGRLVLGEQKEIQEVKNAYAAYEKLSTIDPYQLSDLKKLHGIMTRYTVEEAGIFRRREEGVFDGDTCIFMAPPARAVPGLMEDLFAWMGRERDRVHPLILSAVFHYEFVFIHPFSDGNGRMARLWHTAILTGWKPIFEYIPIESQIERFQEEYDHAIAQCHTRGASDLFIEFMLEQIDLLLDDISAQLSRYGEELSGYMKKLLSVMEPDIPYTANEIMEKLGMRSKESLRKHYLNPAMEHRLVEMEFPEKPRSRNQRYIRRG